MSCNGENSGIAQIRNIVEAKVIETGKSGTAATKKKEPSSWNST